MANPNKVVGKCKVTVDGDLLETDGETEMELGGTTREPVVGDNSAGSFREVEAPSKTTTKLLIKQALSLAALRKIDNATLVTKTDVGITFIVRGAYVQDVISFSSSDGKATVVWGGPAAEEVR
jgi:hypothetical protein